ncbi:MAG: tetratricopeptide repeat protein [Verrucomicrobiota bacterium]
MLLLLSFLCFAGVVASTVEPGGIDWRAVAILVGPVLAALITGAFAIFVARIKRNKVAKDHAEEEAGLPAASSIPSGPSRAADADLNSITNITISSRGENFVGREDALKELHQQLTRPGKVSAITGRGKVDAMHGAGGIGKTQLAVEYAMRYRAHYTARLLVTASSPEQLEEQLAQLVEILVPEATDEQKQNPARSCELVLHWFHQKNGWLLILDNVDTPPALKAVQRVLPRLERGRVLVTSRLDTWPREFEPMPIGLLSKESAASFLLHRTDSKRRRPHDRKDRKDEQAQAEEIAERVDGLALSLEQAAAQINEQHLSLAEYLAKWDKANKAKGDEMMSFVPENSEFREPAAVTWQVSVDAAGAEAQALLRTLSWMSPEPIPMFLVASWETMHAAREQNATSLQESIQDIRAALGKLAAYSLATFKDDSASFTVHRVLMAVTRAQMNEEMREASLSAALRWLSQAMPDGNTNDVDTWPTVTPLAPHAVAACDYNQPCPLEAAPSASLLNEIGLYHNARAEHALAEPLMRRALEIDENGYGPDHPNVAIRLNNLAGLLQDTNRLGEAEPLMRRALEIDENGYGPDHPNVAIGLSNLAQLLKATDRLGEAEPLIRRALKIDENGYGPDHPNVAIHLNNLAGLLQDTNRLAEAEPLMRRALEIDENGYGPDHPNVAIRLNNLAQLLQDTDRLGKAEPFSRRMVTIFLLFELATGHEHPHARAALQNYKLLLMDLGKTEEEARAVIQELQKEVEVTHRKKG